MVAVPPVPILFLFIRWNLAEVAIRIAVRFGCPPMVVADFVVIPDVIVAIVGVIHAIVMMLGAAGRREGHDYGSRKA